MKKIALFLPHFYRGGTLKGAKNVAIMLHLASQRSHEPLEIVFSCVKGHYTSSDFKELVDLKIPVLETTWKTKIGSFSKTLREKSWHGHQYLFPYHPNYDFETCDFWFFVSDRLIYPPLTQKPFGILVYDYVQRYIPEIGSIPVNFLLSTRKAACVITTTEATRKDAIQFAGLDPERVFLLPVEFHPPKKPHDAQRIHPRNYALWVTNSTPHKNHKRALAALERFYQHHESDLDILMIGSYTYLLDSTTYKKKISYDPYAFEIAKMITSSAFQHRYHLLGELSDEDYARAVRDAAFLWHPGLIDNGTLAALDAAYFHVPILSSAYPATRFYEERFQLNTLFFNPHSVEDIYEKFVQMSQTYKEKKQHLPTPDQLKQFDIEHMAPYLWNIIRPLIPS